MLPVLTREDVLDRIDRDTLQSAPLNLLVSTAIAIAPPDTPEATEDAVLKYIDGLDSNHRALAAHARLTAEALVLAFVEYQASINAYAAAETDAPLRSDWANPQHYLDACKVYERRMDRLTRVRKETFERYERASEVYRRAVLTREGHEILIEAAQRRSSQGPVELPTPAPARVGVLPPPAATQTAAIETANGSKVLLIVQ